MSGIKSKNYNCNDNDTKKQIDEMVSQTAKNVEYINRLNDRVFVLETYEEITSEQVDIIRNAVLSRVNYILEPYGDRRHKYFRTFISNIYADARRNADCGNRVACTKKRDFDKVLAYINWWQPSGGAFALTQKVDNRTRHKRRYEKEGSRC